MPAINRYTPTLDRAGVMRFNRGPLNEWDACLINEKIAWGDLVGRNPPLPYCTRPLTKYAPPPWIAMPSEAKRFNRIGTLPVAGNFTGLDVSLTLQGVSGPLFICDNGYDGIITEIVLQAVSPNSTNFVEASGDISWRVGVDFGQLTNTSLYYFRDYGNVQVTTGDHTSPVQLYNNGLRFISGQALSVWVNLAVSAMGRIDANTTILGILGGWTWPR